MRLVPSSPKTPGQNVGNPSVPGSFVKITDVAVEGPAGGNGFTILAATGIAVVPSTTIHGNIGGEIFVDLESNIFLFPYCAPSFRLYLLYFIFSNSFSSCSSSTKLHYWIQSY